MLFRSFLPDGLGGSFADIPPETKNAVSHRATALQALLQVLDAEECPSRKECMIK